MRQRITLLWSLPSTELHSVSCWRVFPLKIPGIGLGNLICKVKVFTDKKPRHKKTCYHDVEMTLSQNSCFLFPFLLILALLCKILMLSTG